MTAGELEGLYYLRREIERDRRRRAELWEKATSATSSPGGMWGPHAGVSDRVGCCAAALADLDHRLALNVERLVRREAELTDYIDSVPDPRMRLILKLRFIDCLPWFRVAMEVGGGNTDESVKKSVYRFLKKTENC